MPQADGASVAPPPAALRGPSPQEPSRSAPLGAQGPTGRAPSEPLRAGQLQAQTASPAAQPSVGPQEVRQRLAQDLAALHAYAAQGAGVWTRLWIRTKRIGLGAAHGALLGFMKAGRVAFAPKNPETATWKRVAAGAYAVLSAPAMIANVFDGIPSILGVGIGIAYGIYDGRGSRLPQLAVRRRAKPLIAKLDRYLKGALYGPDGQVKTEFRNDPSVARELANTIDRLQKDPAIVGAVKARHIKPLQAHLDRLQAPPPVANGWPQWNAHAPSGHPQPAGYPQPPAGYPQPPAGYLQPHAGYLQPHAGYPQPHAGYLQPHAGYPQPTAGYTQPHAGYPQPPAGYPQPHAGHSQPHAGHSQPHAGHPQPHAGHSQPHAGYSQPHAGYSQPHAGYSQPHAGYPAQHSSVPAGYAAQPGPAPQAVTGLTPARPSRTASPAPDVPPSAQPLAPGGAFAPRSAARGYFATPFGATGGAGPLHAASANFGGPAAMPTGHAAMGADAAWRH